MECQVILNIPDFIYEPIVFQSSFARFMSGQGFDTWILEVRGAGLSTHEVDFTEVTDTLEGMPKLFFCRLSEEQLEFFLADVF